MRRDLDRRGVLEAVRSDIARGKALQFLVDAAVVVDSDGNPIDLDLPDARRTDAADTAETEPPEADAAPEEEPEA